MKFPFIWRPATYCQLVEILDEIITNGSFSLNKELDRSVIKDYKDFVKAFCNLAEKWNVTPCMDYRSQIFPWNVNTPDAVAKRKEIDEYKELRIHDRTAGPMRLQRKRITRKRCRRSSVWNRMKRSSWWA